ncbi:flagellar motor protein MotB [Melioribacteraceae bacterium 4301-Me]|uniref:flagellar motor protein MotB n=1 Tax=Pyranulibacter aquaticus TaxID=3163344 RepID=UPI003599353F
MADKEEILIVNKNNKKKHGHAHGGAWKVAYADFVTAMMALFIVLWVLSQSEEVKKAVASYFKDPSKFSIINLENSSGIKNSAIDLNFIANKSVDKEAQKAQFEKLKKDIQKELAKNTEFESLLKQIEFQMVDEGLRIEMLESANNVFFEVGSAKLNPEAEKILLKIGNEIKSLPNKIIVEGHTDARQYNQNIRKDYDNYFLSTDRANAARIALEAGGVSDKQIDEIRGYADKRLRDKKDPYNVVNRRISIIIKYLER